MSSAETFDYLLTNAAEQAETRFAALSTLFDRNTFAHLDTVGITGGWRCWEVGAGGPAVPAWMAHRVGPGGHVVATDIDTRWLDAGAPGVEVRLHDVAVDDPPGGDFDLIHARLVLTHVEHRAEALRRMTSALRPGGWLLLEDFDCALLPQACLDPASPAEERANAIRSGFMRLLTARGVDLEYGRKLPRLLRDHGLMDVAADAYFPVTQAAARLLEHANTAQVAIPLVAHGHATEQQVVDHLHALVEGALDVATPPLVSVRGRRPSDTG